MSKPMRLDKFLSACGVGTRSEVKKLLRLDLVEVNGTVQRDPALSIDPETVEITYRGEQLRYQEHVYLMLHKPEGVVSATDDRWSDTVLDLLEGAYRERALFPVGRLDRDTTGLLLLTDDGPLSHELLSPRKHVEKVYEALLDRPATEADVAAFAQGLNLGDFVSQPAVLTPLEGSRAQVTLTEGKFHQVKRMFEACGAQVLRLHRLSMGPLTLDPALQPGDWGELTPEELQALRRKA